MQDRFKFRVWDETEKNMVYFDGIFYNKKPYTEGSSFPQYDSSPHYHKLSDLMQSTGLKDKNGTLIYEGDIVNYSCLPGYSDIYACTFNNGSFLIGGLLISNTHLKSEVIGNIYESPELLEV